MPEKRIKKKGGRMKKAKSKAKIKIFLFKNARKITKAEVMSAHRAIEKKLKKKRPLRGRPLKPKAEKYKPTSIRLHPQVVSFVKKEAKKRKIGYQSVINEILLDEIDRK